jgi:phage gpG-like protein
MTIAASVDIKGLLAMLNSAEKAVNDKTRVQMLTIGGEVYQQEIRANIARKLNRNSRGALSAGVQVRKVNQYSVRIGVFGVVYAAIHEYGGIITPKRAKVLRFEIGGKVIFSKYVVIPARPYFAPGIKTGHRKADRAMTAYVKKLLKDSVKTK